MTKIKESLKKSFAVLGVAVLLASMAPSFVHASGKALMPRDAISGQPTLPLYAGASACRLDSNLTGGGTVQCAANTTGVLYALCAYGTVAVAGKGAMAFDSAVITATANFGAQSQAISPIVYGTASASTDVSISLPHCWIPPIPIRFETGLGLKTDDAGTDVLAIYRLDSGVNP